MSSAAPQLIPTSRIDLRDLRNALGTFLTGIAVVTAMDKTGSPRGFTANSFTSVSLEPPLVLVCVARTLSSYVLFERTNSFAINILSEAQQHASNVFASRTGDRFAHVNWHVGESGAPILDEPAAWFECDAHDRVIAGDHLILIGRVTSYGHARVRPLGYCRGSYLCFQSEQELAAAKC